PRNPRPAHRTPCIATAQRPIGDQLAGRGHVIIRGRVERLRWDAAGFLSSEIALEKGCLVLGLETNVKPDPALGVGDRLERGRRYLVVIQPGPSVAVAEGTSRLFCDVHRKRGKSVSYLRHPAVGQYA